MTGVRLVRDHWTNYALEACELGAFMVSATLFALLLFHPDSPAVSALPAPGVRRLLMGVAMGATAVAIIYSPPGRRSGAHMNPAITLAFLRLGKIAPVDAAGYIVAQVVGGTLGVLLATALVGTAVAHPAVNYVVTIPPGPTGADLRNAWLGEFAISLVLMTTVLVLSNRRRLASYTGLVCGALVASFIFLEAPLSGMSMNPARTWASAIVARVWTGWWIYLTAPPLAMLLAAEVYRRVAGHSRVYCAKLHHDRRSPCIFRCRFHELEAAPGTPATPGSDRHVIEPL